MELEKAEVPMPRSGGLARLRLADALKSRRGVSKAPGERQIAPLYPNYSPPTSHEHHTLPSTHSIPNSERTSSSSRSQILYLRLAVETFKSLQLTSPEPHKIAIYVGLNQKK